MTDDDIWRLNRGGHDPQKVYAAYAAAVKHTGPADRDPGQDGQGLRHGRGRRGPEHHPPAEEDGRGRAQAVPRPLRHPDHRRASWREVPFYQPRRGQPRDRSTCSERRAALGGYAAGAQRCARTPLRSARARHLQGRCSRARGEREISTTMAFVRVLTALTRDKSARPPRGADRRRRGAHLRHGGAVPPARHLLVAGPALRAGRPRPARCTTARRRTARSWRRASPRPARWPRGSPPAPPTPCTACT